MAENKKIDLDEIFRRLEFLEKENVSLREEVNELKNNDIEFKNGAILNAKGIDGDQCHKPLYCRTYGMSDR